MRKILSILLLLCTVLFAQLDYNHPELEWQTFETEHFQIHFYEATETTAREAAVVAERVYPHITELYQYEPPEKTDLVFLDIDDFSNGFAFFYDNKIYIWATPLDFNLRGSHRWLQEVVTHEFSHIVSMQVAMKAGLKIPAAYLQFMGYEKEKRQDVLYGYPNRIISYPLPFTTVPPWLAEGVAQYNYEGASWDIWDSHRDMLLRDRVRHNELFSLAQMNTFGKKGVGNESIYNSGFALTKYIAVTYGPDKLRLLFEELGRPMQYNINRAIENVLGLPADRLYNEFKSKLEQRYSVLTESVKAAEQTGKVISTEGTANLYPVWNPSGSKFAYLSNKNNDYMSQTDLYVYDLEDNSEELIAKGIWHAATWHPDGHTIYYNKRNKQPNKHGSRYFDLYQYDFGTEKEQRLTVDSRAYSPVFVPADSAIAYLTSYDGYQNIYYLHLKDNSIEKLTDFNDHRAVYSLNYDASSNQLLFDYSNHHFRNIGYLSLADSSLGDVFNAAGWDERNMVVGADGQIVYSQDKSGIFNLYSIDPVSGRQGYLTNVFGGAFTPSISVNGQILYSMYDDQSYNIVLLDSLSYVDQEDVGYNADYYVIHGDLAEPIATIDETPARLYTDDFTTMFILPKLMYEYGTFKPGIYFYSAEVLNRVAVFGQASVNKDRDLDLYLLFELNRFKPTWYTEVIYLTRNQQEQNYYSVYPIDDNLRFRLIQLQTGLRWRLFGFNQVNTYLSWQRYRTLIKEKLPTSSLEQGLAYDYYRAVHLGVLVDGNLVKPRADSGINPSKGLSYHLDLKYELNEFINGLNLSDAGTLVEEFDNNNLFRVYLESESHFEIPYTNRWTFNVETNLGWLSNAEADSFFNFFAGGLPGLQGYPFYSIEGNKQAVGKLTLRVPWLYLRSFPVGWFSLSNSTIGLIGQFGDAWSNGWDHFDLKRSVGMELRFDGFSFYNYPTAIGLELHYGLDEFQRNINGDIYRYGKEPRVYASILFGF